MSPQLESPKGILIEQAKVPKTVLGQTPLAPLGEGLSNVLATAAGVLPDVPALPAPTGVLPSPPALMGQAPPIPDFVKGLGAGLPSGLPNLEGVTEIGVGGKSTTPTASVFKIGV